MRFLLVEDEYYARKALKQSVLMWKQDAFVAEADNGVSALTLLEKSRFDVVMLDIRMPQMDGIKLAEHIHSRWSDTYMIMITGYKEFEYAKAAIRTNVREYLLKPVDDDNLCEALARALEYIEEKQQQVREVQGLRQDGLSLRQLLSLQRLRLWLMGQEEACDWQEGYSHCMVLRVYGFQCSGELAEQMLGEAMRKRDQFDADMFIVSDRDLCVFIRYRSQEPSRRERLDMLEDIRTDILAKGMLCRMAMSGLTEIGRAPRAYEQAQIALNHRLIRGEGVLSYGMLKEQTFYCKEPKPEELTDFSRYLLRGETSSACQLACQVIKRVMGYPNVSIAALQDALNHLCSQMNIAISRSLAEEGTANGELLQISLSASDFDTPLALLARLETVTKQVCALHDRVCLSNSEQIVNYLKHYIEDHYRDNVSLKELAESKLYLNPSYLSRLFKAGMGISFKSYLTQVRMEQARRMLESRDRSIMSIAEECGYADASQFIQLFRKHFSATPSVFRARLMGYQTE